MIKKLSILILMLTITFLVAYSEEGSTIFCDNTYSIFYDHGTDKLLVCCMGWPGSVNLVNPLTCTIAQSIQTYGNQDAVVSIQNGANLLISTSEIDQSKYTEDSLLTSMDLSTGLVDAQVEVDGWTTDMVVDCDESFVYLSVGLDFHDFNNDNKLIKYSLPNLTKILEMNFLAECHDIEISNDGTKLYAHDGRERVVKILNTSNLSEAAESIFVMNVECNLKIGYDNRLFISVGDPFYGEGGYSLYVVDTETDQVIRTFDFGGIGMEFTDINPYTHRLYGNAYTNTYQDPEFEGTSYEPSSSIIEVNLDNYSYNIIPFGSQKYWEIAVASENGMNRVFCRESMSNLIQYKDI